MELNHRIVRAPEGELIGFRRHIFSYSWINKINLGQKGACTSWTLIHISQFTCNLEQQKMGKFNICPFSVPLITGHTILYKYCKKSESLDFPKSHKNILCKKVNRNIKFAFQWFLLKLKDHVNTFHHPFVWGAVLLHHMPLDLYKLLSQLKSIN